MATDDRPRRDCWGADMTHEHRITVHEQERDDRPVLYDAKGNPLMRRREPLGFQPPSDRRAPP